MELPEKEQWVSVRGAEFSKHCFLHSNVNIFIEHLSHPRSCYRVKHTTRNKTDKDSCPLGACVLVSGVRQVKKKRQILY